MTTKVVQRSIADAVTALDRATLPLWSAAGEFARQNAAEFRRLFEPVEQLASVQRALTENLAIMDVVKAVEESQKGLLREELQAFESAGRLAKQISESQLVAMDRAVKLVGQSLITDHALMVARAEGTALDSLSAISAALGSANLDLANRLEPFANFEEYLHRQGVALGGESLARHIADIALASLPLQSLPWNEPTGLLSVMEESDAAASVTWWGAADFAEIDLAMLRKPVAKPVGPTLTVEAEVTCFLCGAPLATQNASYEWLSEGRAMVRLPTIPVCAQCIRSESRSYLDRIVEALDQRPRGPRFEILQGGGGGDGRPRSRDHLRLVKRDVGSEEEDED